MSRSRRLIFASNGCDALRYGTTHLFVVVRVIDYLFDCLLIVIPHNLPWYDTMRDVVAERDVTERGTRRVEARSPLSQRAKRIYVCCYY